MEAHGGGGLKATDTEEGPGQRDHYLPAVEEQVETSSEGCGRRGRLVTAVLIARSTWA
jgi:hypothetical protein